MSEPADLDFVPTRELVDALHKRSKTLFLVYRLSGEKEDGVWFNRVSGQLTDILGLVERTKYDCHVHWSLDENDPKDRGNSEES